MSKSINKSTRIANDVKFQRGLEETYAKSDTFTVKTKKVTVAQIIALIVARVEATRASESAKAAWIAAAKEEATRVAESEAVLAGVRQILRASLGADNQALADFGIVPHKRAELSVEDKVAALEKRRKTREARHVMGRKQRLAITGDTPTPAAAAPAVTHGATSGAVDTANGSSAVKGAGSPSTAGPA